MGATRRNLLRHYYMFRGASFRPLAIPQNQTDKQDDSDLIRWLRHIELRLEILEDKESRMTINWNLDSRLRAIEGRLRDLTSSVTALEQKMLWSDTEDFREW